MGVMWFGIFLFVFGALAYNKASLHVWTIGIAVFLLFLVGIGPFSIFTATFCWLLFLIIFIPLYANSWRRQFITSRILNKYREVMPTMSRTEREALAAGSVTWEGDLFKGAPDWNKLLQFPKPQLTPEEQEFIDGPVETLCGMINDWDITHNRADLPPEMWQYLKDQGFFGLIIPKKYGGKEFSAYAHSQILVKIYAVSASVATSVSVPNSLGPAELLLHYGTEEQKTYYLPRLARGEEVPCFALTGLDAGSDAGSMTDTGTVCWGEFQGEKTLGIRLNWNKRYITLAPIATVIGLAFKLYDPDHLIGEKESLGITCALIPRNTPGITIGRRHFPVNIVFQNGPTQGKNVFIPLDRIIGGVKMAGHGWRMLMECLAAGRGISLPASSLGGAKALVYAGGAYARIRRQFNVPIGSFEGIEEVLARIGGYTYIMDATRTFTTGMISLGEKPAVASAITKYHVTEFGRLVANDAMDLHGGKGICLGPNNYLGRFYESVPIAITVEGANILTRCMIIFGQGAMRCHPYIFKEFEAARQKDETKRLIDFDNVLLGHLSFLLSNFVRSFVLSWTSGYFTRAPSGKLKRYFQQATRFSAAFALTADVSLILLGGALKRKENISARLGDILSQLYQLSSVLKLYYDQGQPEEDFPVVQWASEYCLYQIQRAFSELFDNFPNRIVAHVLKLFVLPFGKRFRKPSDYLGHQIAQLLTNPTATRDHLSAGAFLGNKIAVVQDAFLKTIAAEPVEKIIKTAFKEEKISGDTLFEKADSALAKKIISKKQYELIKEAEEARIKVILVDDFAPEELMHASITLEQDTYATSTVRE